MNSSRVSTLIVQTPEGIAFSLPLACPVTRCLAWVVDIICIMGVMAVITTFLKLADLISPDLGGSLAAVCYFVVQMAYGIACEWLWRGQTVGKRLLGLRVIDGQGLRLQFNQVVLRNLVRAVDILPFCYLVGGAASWLSPRSQRLGDLVANTIVVRHLKTVEPDVEQLMAGKYNSLREYPHLAARLRQRVSPGEAALALQALLRREQLDLQARLDLFDQMATHFSGLVAFPPEAWEGITPEQYVRNIVDLIFRPRLAANR